MLDRHAPHQVISSRGYASSLQSQRESCGRREHAVERAPNSPPVFESDTRLTRRDAIAATFFPRPTVMKAMLFFACLAATASGMVVQYPTGRMPMPSPALRLSRDVRIPIVVEGESVMLIAEEGSTAADSASSFLNALGMENEGMP